MTFPIFFDTNALFGSVLCDLTLRLAEEGAFLPLWSEGVLAELERNLAQRIGADAAVNRVEAMRAAFPDASVIGYESLISAMTCDPKDRHVLAAAVRADAEVLVTFDLGDFPASATDPFSIVVRSPDEFLQDQLDLYPALCLRTVHALADTYERPPLTVAAILNALQASAPVFAAAVRRML